MVSLHQAEIKGSSGAILFPQGRGSSKNIPLLLRAESIHVLPIFPLFSSQLLGSSYNFSSKIIWTFAYQRKNLKGFARNSWSACFHNFQATPGAITWQRSHKRHHDQLFLLQRYKPRIKDTYACLDRKLAMQSKEVSADIKFPFLPTSLLQWGAQPSQSIEMAFLFDWAGSLPQGRHINTKRTSANNCVGLYFTWHIYICTSYQVKGTHPTQYSYQTHHSYWPSPQEKFQLGYLLAVLCGAQNAMHLGGTATPTFELAFVMVRIISSCPPAYAHERWHVLNMHMIPYVTVTAVQAPAAAAKITYFHRLQ